MQHESMAMQIIQFRIFVYLHVSTGTSKGDKLLRIMPSDSISEGVIYVLKFSGDMPPDP